MAFCERLCVLCGVVAVGLVVCGCATMGPSTPCAVSGGPEWPLLVRRATPEQASAAAAAMPLPRDMAQERVDALVSGGVTIDGVRVQAQPVAYWEGGDQARRVILRWCDEAPEHFSGRVAMSTAGQAPTAGWAFDYRLLEASPMELPWKVMLRDAPLEETHYEMYQLELKHGDQSMGVCLGLRTEERIYWWQFVRADFVQRGPVFDVLRAGGPIYNGRTSIHGDVYLVLYANGVIEAYAHFVNNQRESEATDAHGIPVVAFDAPDMPVWSEALDGTQSRYGLGSWMLEMGQTSRLVSAERPGALQSEDGVTVWQPWQDQEIFGMVLAHSEGVPDHRIIRKSGPSSEHGNRAASDEYWVAMPGDMLIPEGVARTVRFTLSPSGTPPCVARYDAPAWWHARCGALPTMGLLPVTGWATQHALAIGEQYFTPDADCGPFEDGRRGRSSDGTLSAAMSMLGTVTETSKYLEEALPSAYWWTDIATDHAHFLCHEVPKFSWQWIVPPYTRWMEAVHAYWQTGDPYLLDTARFVADGWYRFFWTNRPHRTVGRDALAVSCMLALYQTTGEVVYLDRTRDILAEARRSYGQPEHYWPGHQSGVGPNGVGRYPDWNYIPMLLARLHVEYLADGDHRLDDTEREAMWAYIRRMVELVQEHSNNEGWVLRALTEYYTVAPALVERYPSESDKWLGFLASWNAEAGMPEAHDGGKPFDWILGAITLDAWTWGATWENGALVVKPRAVLDDPRAPKRATIMTPEGPVELEYHDGEVVRGE